MGDAALILAVAAALFAASLWRSRRSQQERLRALERRAAPPPPPPRYRPVALRTLVPPAETEQPTLQGRALPGGLMAWTGAEPAGDVVAELVVTRDAPCAYVGHQPEAVARRVAERARSAGVDPTARLVIAPSMDDPATALERFLDARPMPPPWIVAEAGADVEALRRLHRRFGCSVLLLGPEAPHDFQQLML